MSCLKKELEVAKCGENKKQNTSNDDNQFMTKQRLCKWKVYLRQVLCYIGILCIELGILLSIVGMHQDDLYVLSVGTIGIITSLVIVRRIGKETKQEECYEKSKDI